MLSTWTEIVYKSWQTFNERPRNLSTNSKGGIATNLRN